MRYIEVSDDIRRLTGLLNELKIEAINLELTIREHDLNGSSVDNEEIKLVEGELKTLGKLIPKMSARINRIINQ